MADSKNSKISELVELTDPSNADYIPIVDTANEETKKISYTSLVAALNEDDDSYSKTEADAAIAAVQANADAAIAAVQADVDQNESDADAAIAAVQADVDQNELDADAAIAAVQADVDQNESDADAAIAANTTAITGKAPIASPTLTGGVTISDATGSQFAGSGSGLVVGDDNTHTAENSITVGKDNTGTGGSNAIIVGEDNDTSQENAVVLGSGNILTSLDPPSAATDTVYDTFNYTAGGYLKHNSPEVSGQNWSGGWDGPSGQSWRITGTGQSLFFNQGTGLGLATDGTAHIWCEDQVENYRNLDTAISASTTYCTMLVRPYDTAPYDPDTNPNPGTGGVERVKFRIEFYSGTDASGNMRLNAGIDQGTLFVGAITSGYGIGDTQAGAFEDGKTYLLAMKRTGIYVYASLIEADGDPTTLDSEPTWQVTQAGTTGVNFQSIKLFGNNTDPNNDRGIRVDELRIADNWADAVAGLRYDEGVKSIAIGTNNTIGGTSDAIAIGKDNNLSGIRSYAMGEGLKDYGDNSTLLLGRYNENPADDSKLVIASGLSDTVRFTAMEFKARDDAFSNNSGIVMQALYRSASYLNDSQAAAGGVELGELYRAGNDVKIRMA